MSTATPDQVPYTSWTTGVIKHPVAALENRHVIHSYYLNNPESPDGRYVLYYTSGVTDGEQGDLRLLERGTGKATIVARNVTTEDAHRAANQQWADGGRAVVYQDYRQGRWFVVAVDLKTLEEKILAEDRQLGFGSAQSDSVPVVGCHWNPRSHRNLELVHVETGAIRTAVTADSAVEQYPDWMHARFGDAQLSICFPTVSPDGKRVFFKMARGNGGNDFRSPNASDREGKVVYDLEKNQFLCLLKQWGHPSWHPDSKRIFEKGSFLWDPETGESEHFVGSPSDHPTISPDGQLFTTDGKEISSTDGREYKKGKDWVIVVGNIKEDGYVVIDKFDNAQGATSWRHNHPHPAFSADGRRIYYNVNSGPWTRLFVAESHPGNPLSA